MDPSERRKIRNKALVLWGIFAPLFLVFSFSSGTSTSQDFSVLGVATVVTTLVVVGLPVTYVFVFASHWLGSRWRGLRRPSPLRGPPLGPSAAPSPFSYMGRRWRPIAGILTFVFALLAVSWLLPMTGVIFIDALLIAFRLLAIGLAAFAVPASALGLREVTFEVDDLGVRLRGRLRPFDIRWDDVERLEVTQYPSPPFPFGEAVKVPKTYALWRKTGTVAGIIAPGGELDKQRGAALESAVLAYATRRGISVVEVPWRASRLWWKMREHAIRSSSR